MNFTLSFLPEVEEDAILGYHWYEEKSIGLGEEFLRLFYVYSKEISRDPYLYNIKFNNFRRRLLRHYPYAVYFKIIDNTVIIFGLFHCARNPEFITDTLTTRKV